MTLASDLAHLVSGTAVYVPGTVHDPNLPLVLGSQGGGLFVVQDYNTGAKQWRVQATDAAAVGTLTFDATGALKINGVGIESLPAIQAQVNAAAASASAAATSATTSLNGATSAGTAAVTAQTAADDAVSDANAASSSAVASQAAADAADEAAILAQQWANAGIDVALPGGGVSAAVSAAKAAQYANESRDLDFSDPVTASETFQAGFFGTERQVTAAGLITITMPRGIYTASDKLMRWGSYKLASATGSVKVIGDISSSIATPTKMKDGRFAIRIIGTISSTTRTMSKTISIGNVTDGVLVIIVTTFHLANTNVPAVVIGNDSGLVFTQVGTPPALAPGLSAPVFHVWKAPMVAFAAKTIAFTVQGGNGLEYMGWDFTFIEGHHAADNTIRRAVSPNPDTAAASATAALTAVADKSLLLAVAYQNAIATESLFASWSPEVTRIRYGTSAGIDDAGTPDTTLAKNASHSFASGGNPAPGDVAVTGVFTGSGKVGVCLVEVPGKVSGSVAVDMKYEGGRDTLTVPYGVMEIWAQPDGNTYHVRTPKP